MADVPGPISRFPRLVPPQAPPVTSAIFRLAWMVEKSRCLGDLQQPLGTLGPLLRDHLVTTEYTSTSPQRVQLQHHSSLFEGPCQGNRISLFRCGWVEGFIGSCLTAPSPRLAVACQQYAELKLPLMAKSKVGEHAARPRALGDIHCSMPTSASPHHLAHTCSAALCGAVLFVWTLSLPLGLAPASGCLQL